MALPFTFLPFYFFTLLIFYSSNMKYSIIVPVFNRPEEVDELLQSLTQQSYANFDVVIVEDGSQ